MTFSNEDRDHFESLNVLKAVPKQSFEITFYRFTHYIHEIQVLSMSFIMKIAGLKQKQNLQISLIDHMN